MSYAIRSDGSAWRAVDGPEQCDDSEVWSDSAPPALEPTPVDEPLQITEAQAAKLKAFLQANPDIFAT